MLANHRGYSLIELMTGAALVTASIAILGTVIVNTRSKQVQYGSIVELHRLQAELIQSLQNATAWTATLTAAENTSGMACLRTGAPCTVDGTANGTPIANQPFAAFDRAGQLLFDSTSAQNGISMQGNRCTGFSAAGSDACPYRLNLTWSAICTAGDCVGPQIRIDGPLQFSPKTNYPLNQALHSLPPIYRRSTAPASAPVAGPCFVNFPSMSYMAYAGAFQSSVAACASYCAPYRNNPTPPTRAYCIYHSNGYCGCAPFSPANLNYYRNFFGWDGT